MGQYEYEIVLIDFELNSLVPLPSKILAVLHDVVRIKWVVVNWC